MSKKEPTRAQLSSRLAYSSQTPAFLLKLQRKVAGQEDDEDEPQYEDYEDDGSGRPPIPRRPAIPTRPDDDPGSAEEDDGDEAPQIVVLREGKHLTQRDVENEKRRAKGLPPLPEATSQAPSSSDSKDKDDETSQPKSAAQQGLSFSSSGSKSASGGKKRKAVGDGKDDVEDSGKKKAIAKTKKPKKTEKKLLSFDEDA